MSFYPFTVRHAPLRNRFVIKKNNKVPLQKVFQGISPCLRAGKDHLQLTVESLQLQVKITNKPGYKKIYIFLNLQNEISS